MSVPRNDDAQRELERRALRNVRTLVDRMEDTDAADARTQKRMLGAILAIVAAVGLGTAAILFFADKPQPVTIDVAKLPPVKHGPPDQARR